MNTISRESVSKTDERINKLADQLSTFVEIVSKKVVTPAPVKAVEETCVTCGGAHSWYNCPTTNNNQASVCATTVIMEYLVNISKRHAFWSLNKDILKINDSDYQYVVSIKEDTAYPCLHSPKTTRPIHRIQERRHFKTLSLDELRSPDFNLRSDQEYSEEEVAKTMAETMEQYMSKTRADYGSGFARPKIDNKDQFELKGQFLKELQENTFSGSNHEDANEHIEKVLEIVDLFHVPNIIVDQLMLRVFPISLTAAASH
ncbi:hypothetical protein Tco_1309721 [Tanacetum coccineum]